MKAIRKYQGLTVLILVVAAVMLFFSGGLQAASGPDTFRFVVYADSRGN